HGAARRGRHRPDGRRTGLRRGSRPGTQRGLPDQHGRRAAHRPWRRRAAAARPAHGGLRHARRVTRGLDHLSATVGRDRWLAELEVVTYTYAPQSGTMYLRRNNQVVAENVPTFQMQYVDDNGTVGATPGANVRSVTVTFEAAQAAQLPDNPTAKSRVSTEANM